MDRKNSENFFSSGHQQSMPSFNSLKIRTEKCRSNDFDSEMSTPRLGSKELYSSLVVNFYELEKKIELMEKRNSFLQQENDVLRKKLEKYVEEEIADKISVINCNSDDSQFLSSFRENGEESFILKEQSLEIRDHKITFFEEIFLKSYSVINF